MEGSFKWIAIGEKDRVAVTILEELTISKCFIEIRQKKNTKLQLRLKSQLKKTNKKVFVFNGKKLTFITLQPSYFWNCLNKIIFKNRL